ncbi:MAG: hypothetical protein FJ044_04255 [Candidatus Cloacimonetes bacterium]|nr:hypothetical protein [Candidatus Cloacimonadota bacterium]
MTRLTGIPGGVVRGLAQQTMAGEALGIKGAPGLALSLVAGLAIPGPGGETKAAAELTDAQIARRTTKLLNEARGLLGEQVSFLKSQMDEGTVSRVKDEAGRVIKRVSTNAPWYREFFAEFKRAPRKNELIDIAKKQLVSGENVPPEISKRFSEIETAVETFKSTPLKVPAVEAPDKYAFNLNFNRLGLDDKEKKLLRAVVEKIKPSLEQVKGKTLSNDEVLEAAGRSNLLQKIVTKDETKQATAQVLRTRQEMVAVDKEITALGRAGKTEQMAERTKDLIENLRVVSANAADWGRKLQSLDIEAGDTSLRQKMLAEIAKIEIDTDKIAREAVKVDWNNAKSITNFYRQFIKPTTTEVLTEFRYNNMLSSPRTHLRNAFSNLTQTFFTRPITRLTAKGFKSAIKYYQGAIKSLPDATEAFSKSFRGETLLEKPDIARIPTGKLPSFMTIPTRAMEAGDKFFGALIRGGEMAAGASPEEAAKVAEISLFRAGLDPTGKEGQGYLLRTIDNAIQGLYAARKKIPGGDWVIPFIRTPMNFAKQWLEYSPIGVTTMPGAVNKKEQLAKALLGATFTAMGAKMAQEDKITWSAPTSAKQKELFYAAGKKPFSIKIGDKWVPMVTAGPFAFALAIPAVTKRYQEESGMALDEQKTNKLQQAVGDLVRFYANQTPLTQLNSFIRILDGDIDFNLVNNAAYMTSQLIPFTGLMRYIAQTIDPVYRKGQGFVDTLKVGLPELSKTVEPYLTPEGKESLRLSINRFLPYDIGKVEPKMAKLESAYTMGLELKRTRNKILDLIKQGKEQEAYALKKESGISITQKEVKNMMKSYILELIKQGKEQEAYALKKKYEISIKESEVAQTLQTEVKDIYKSLPRGARAAFIKKYETIE